MVNVHDSNHILSFWSYFYFHVDFAYVRAVFEFTWELAPFDTYESRVRGKLVKSPPLRDHSKDQSDQ